MKWMITASCCLFAWFCTFPLLANAEEFEWAKKARERGPSPAAKAAYEKIKERNEQRKKEAAEKILIEKVDTAVIEEKLLSRDIEAAKTIVEKYRWDAPMRHESELVIDCVENILWFNTFLNQDHDTNAAIVAYAPMIQSCNNLPDEIPFSEKLVNAINGSIDQAEKFIAKECGKDYGQIRVGMTLSRAQKCVGEFFLHGQIEGKHGTVDYYTRGDIRLYVKKGKVVAWDQ